MESNTNPEESKAEDQLDGNHSKVTRLFVWGSNEKKQLGLNSDLFDDLGTDEANSNNNADHRSNHASSNAGS